MAKFEIISKNGELVRSAGCPKYTGTFMGVSFLEFSTIESPTLIDWEVGDYVDYYRTGLRYKLFTLPIPKKQARSGAYGASFVYSNVKFYSATKELEIAPFRDIVTEDNKIHFSTRPEFSTYEDVYGIARRIQACMDDLFPNKWRIEVYKTEDEDLLGVLSEAKNFSLSNSSCLEALSEIYDIWKNVGWVHSYDSSKGVDVITIGRTSVRDEENTSDAYAYGVGKGLTSIKKAAANEDEFATRLYVYGSDRNIPNRYYNGLNILNAESVDIQNLMLPVSVWGETDGLPDAKKAFLQADQSIIDKYGLIPRTIYFNGGDNEDVYPSIQKLLMSDVRKQMIESGQGDSIYLPDDMDVRIDKTGAMPLELDNGTKEEVEVNRTFIIHLPKLGFDLVEQGKLTEEGVATIAMKTGSCAGREFNVKVSNMQFLDTPKGYQTCELERAWDESLQLGFPNNNYWINEGDEYVILDIPMPDFYITLAEKKLLDAGQKMLNDYTRVSAYYEPAIDSIKIKEGGKLLREGMFMQITDADIIDTESGTDFVLIDSLSIDEKAELPKYSVTLREQKRSSRGFSVLEDMVEDTKEETKEAIKKERQYTDRRFRSAQQTLDMLVGAFDNFSYGIDPITIRTMATLVGDESLQFKFTDSIDSLDDVQCPLSYDSEHKQMYAEEAALVHMTLDVGDVTIKSSRELSSYRRWHLPAWRGAVLDDATKAYYVYVKASRDTEEAEYCLSTASIKMAPEGDSSYYFLVGILNSEHVDNRDFVTLYGFTEILPGQITTDIIRSGNGSLIIDLVNAVIEAKNGATIKGSLVIGSGSSGLEELSEWDAKQEQINKAQSLAKDANDTLGEWASDGIISPVEKQALKDELAFIDADYDDLSFRYKKYIMNRGYYVFRDGSRCITRDGKALKVGVSASTASWLDYVQAHTAYKVDLQAKIDSEDSVAVGELDSLRSAFYSARTAIVEDISLAIKADADESKRVAQDAMGKVEKIEPDFKRLTDTFGDASNLSVEGVVMSQTVAVADSGDASTANITAFLNGSDFGRDAEHGKLILVGGIPNGTEDFEERSKKASTRIYEDGCAFTKNMHLENGCSIGDDIHVTDIGIEIENSFHGGTTYLNGGGFTYDGLIETTYPNGTPKWEGTHVDIGGCGNTGIRVAVGDEGYSTLGGCPTKGYEIGVIVSNDSGKESFRCNGGMFAGLRPNTRVISETGTSDIPNEITKLDHTVILAATSGTIYLSLPENPQEGQRYEIFKCRSGVGLEIQTHGLSVYSIVSGGVVSDISLSSSQRADIDLIYASGQWWLNYRYLS